MYKNMTKNPIHNALAAAIYILGVASLLRYMSSRFADTPDTFLAPVAMLSLFTLSAAVMGYIFFYEPFRLYFGGEKEKAANLFLKTLKTFAGITLLIFWALIFGLLR